MPKSKKAREPVGIQFPITAGGKRSTTTTGKAILGAALTKGNESQSAQLAAEKDRKWRGGYQKHIMKAVQLMAECDQKTLKSICMGGLTQAHSLMEFHRDKKMCSMTEAMTEGKFPGTFETGTVIGTGPKVNGVSVPFEGKEYKGDAMINLVQKWADSGNMDSTAVHGLQAVLDNKSWLDLSGQTFVIIGATSEMGPFQFLLEYGATVVAIARRKKNNKGWRRLMELAAKSRGKMIFPYTGDGSDKTAQAGADVLSQTPELTNWLVSVCPDDQPVTVGCYIYLDGQDFVRASIAMDAVFSTLSARRSAPTGLALLETPSHSHVVPGRCKTFSVKYRRNRPLWQSVLSLLTILKPLKFTSSTDLPQLQGQPSVVVNALVGVQGPNYAMAKMIQRWRVCATKLDNQQVSCNVAPPAATDSVMHVKKVAFAVKNMHHLEPNYLFPPDTVCRVMALLLIRDIKDSKGTSNRASAHPFELIADQAWHGGNWTCGWSGDTAGVAAFICGGVKILAVMVLVLVLLYTLLL